MDWKKLVSNISFRGRIPRGYFIKAILCFLICDIILSIVGAVALGRAISNYHDQRYMDIIVIMPLIVAIPMLLGAVILMIAIAAIVVKRLHDVNKEGYYAYLLLLPFVDIVMLLLLMFIPGTPGDNNYGKEPI